MALKIHLFNKQDDLPINRRMVRSLVKAFLKLEEVHCHEVSIYFVDEKTICQLHEQFFDDPSPTDCISFPMDGPEEITYRILGEVFICPQAAIAYSAKRKVNPLNELSLYVIHGLLHLIGYDDIDPKDRAKMRLAEKRHLESINAKNISLSIR
jgi:probable rRNA maturation factor